MSTQVSRSVVGIELMEGEECDAIIEAIMDDRPETEVTSWSAVIRLDVPDRVVIRRAKVEEHLGREWNTRDLNQVVSAYHGYFTQWDADVILLSWDPDDREVPADV